MFKWGLGQMWRARPNGLGQSGYPPQRNKRALGKKRGSNQQVELKDEGGAAGPWGMSRRSPKLSGAHCIFQASDQIGRDKFEKSESILS